MSTEQLASRGRLWIVLSALLLGVTAVVLAVVLLVGGGGPGAPQTFALTNEAVPEDAEVAWEVDIPSEVYFATSAGEVTVVAYAEEGLVAYDEDGSEQWTADGDGAIWDESGERLLVIDDESVRALSPDDGKELWALEDIDPGSVQSRGDRVVVESTPVSDCVDEECFDEPATVRVLDVEDGDEVASADGTLEAVGDSGFLVANDADDEVRMIDLSGDEQWTEEVEPAGPIDAAFGDGLVLLGAEDGDEDMLTALDPESGDELWTETGGTVYSPGVDGTVAVEREDGDDHELVFYDADGERGAVPLDGSLMEGAGLGVSAYSYPYRVEEHGEIFIDSVSNQIIDADLEVIAEYDQQIVDICADGPYLLEGDRLTLGSWDSEEAQYSIGLEDTLDAEDLDANGVWSLDGAVAVAAGDTLKVYR